MTLTGRLVILIALTLLPAFAIEAYSEYATWRTRQADVRQEARRQALQAAADLDRIAEGVRNVLEAVAAVPAVRSFQTDECAPYLEQVHQRFQHLASLLAIGLDGRLRCQSQASTADLRFDERPSFQAAAGGQPFVVGTYLRGRVTGRAILPFAVPVRDTTGQVVGVVGAGLDLGWLAARMHERPMPAGGVLTVADRDGVIVARTQPDAGAIGSRLAAPFLDRLHASAPGLFEMRSPAGERWIYADVPAEAPPLGLYVSVGISDRVAFAAVNRSAVRSVALLAAGVLLALLAAWQAGRYFIRRPFRLLLAAVQAGSRGDYAARVVAPAGAGEFAVLGRAYNDMVRLVAERAAERDRVLDELRQRDDRLGELNRTLEHRVETAVAAHAQAEAALHQAQKMEAVGQLTGGVAHDFNNLLTGIIGNLELLERRTPPEGRRYLEGALRAADRGARLTGQLLAFARRQQLDIRVVDLNAVVMAMDDLLRRTLGGLVRIELALDPALWPALADPTQVELVLLNLAINARDAMPDGGVLTVATANRTLSHRPGDHGPASGDYAALTVRDTGTGMTPEVRARAFEPFFTTKEVGRGSGLGLPQVLGVVTQLGGGLDLESAPGTGTAITVYLARAPTPAASVGEPPPAALAPDIAGTRVLLVDDDPDVRNTTLAMLQELGCQVTTADSGVAALHLLDSRTASRLTLDIALIDFAMPGMSGADTAAWIAERWPQLPVLIMTGYADDGLPGVDPRRRPMLRKPFRAADLTAAIRAALAGGPAVARHSEPHSL